MSLETVQSFLSRYAPDIEVMTRDVSLASVNDAAKGLGVSPPQIAKTMALIQGDTPILLVLRGDARLDNRKYRDQFGVKAKMISPEDVEAITSHPVGGVCPFGLPEKIPVYCDISLKDFDEVFPAAGSPGAALRISPSRLADLTEATWVNVAK